MMNKAAIGKTVLLAAGYVFLNFLLLYLSENSNHFDVFSLAISAGLAAAYTALHLSWLAHYRYTPFIVVAAFTMLFVLLLLFLIGQPQVSAQEGVFSIFRETATPMGMLQLYLPSALSLLMTIFLKHRQSKAS